MISEKLIEKLMQPILNRQEALNSYVIKKIAARVKEIGHLLPSDVYKLEQLLKSGSDVREINKELARLTKLNEAEIKKMIKAIAQEAYKDAKPFYDYRHLSYIPFEKNETLQRTVQAIARQTAETYLNLSQSRAFMIRDRKNPQKLIPTTLSKTYYSVVDEAVQTVQLGIEDYDTAMRRTLKQLAQSGLRTVQYHPESGKLYTQSLEAAVKRNLLDGVRAINQGVQDVTGEQYGADGKEITVHEHSAPDHEPIQGHQFTNEEFEKLQNAEPFEDVQGRKFDAIERAIGEYNCYHYTYSIIIGVNKPNFTQAELDANIARNHKGYTDSKGKHHTLYECTQIQRQMERDIRQAKQSVMTGKAADDVILTAQAKVTLHEKQKAYREFSRACGLPQKPLNVHVTGYQR